MKIKKLNLTGSIFIYFLLIILVLLLCIFSITIGIADIGFFECFDILLNGLVHGIQDSARSTIIFDLRIPRILLAMLTGMNLAITGSIYQAIFRNSMADPYILGVSSGASLGAAIAFMTGFAVPFLAFIGAIIASFIVFFLAGAKGKMATIRLVLAGIGVNYLFSAMLTILRAFSNDRKIELFMWGMGSFSSASYKRVIFLFFISVPIIVYFFIKRKDLNIILLGDDVAKTLGVNAKVLRMRLLILSSILIALTVSFTGTIGFVGLVVPHVIRIINGANYRKNFIFIIFLGIIFMLVCDNIARSLLSSSEIPIGIITSIFGAPYFMYLVYKEKKKSYD